MEEMRKNNSFFFDLEARDPRVLFPSCRRAVPGLITRCCLSLPAHTPMRRVLRGCYVSALQLSPFQGHCLWRREAEMSGTTVTIEKWHTGSNLLEKSVARVRLNPTFLFS